MTAYVAAIAGEPALAKARQKTGTLAWLISRYRDSASWGALSPATKKQRENIFLHVIETAGEEPFAKITRKTITASRDRRKATPFAANNFLKTMRGLFRWALESGFVDSDPTEGVKGSTPRTKGFHAWSEEEIERFEARWPIGTRERLALAIMLYTGLRRGDAGRLGRQHVREGVIVVRIEKTGTPVQVPILPELAKIINETRTGDLAFIATPGGRPMRKESFGTWFRGACKAAGVPGSAHGLRKAGATRAANNGATEAELEAIFGWKGGKWRPSIPERRTGHGSHEWASTSCLFGQKGEQSCPAPANQVRKESKKR
jgi:integrase